MPYNREIAWIVCYDIADPRRLVRVHRQMKRYGVPVQYSVFLVRATRKALTKRLKGKIRPLIDSRFDDLRAYPLMSQSKPEVFGRGSVPDGVSVLDKWHVLVKNHSVDEQWSVD